MVEQVRRVTLRASNVIAPPSTVTAIVTATIHVYCSGGSVAHLYRKESEGMFGPATGLTSYQCLQTQEERKEVRARTWHSPL